MRPMHRTSRAPLNFVPRPAACLAPALAVALLLTGCGKPESAPKAPTKSAAADAQSAAKDAGKDAAAAGAKAGQAAPAKDAATAAVKAPTAPAAPKAAEAAAPAVAAAPPAPIDDVAVKAVDAFIAGKKIDTTKSGWKTSLPKPELATFDAKKSYFWDVKTNLGDLRFKLMADVAPMHVTNAIYLTRLGFFDGTIVHRDIKGFMAQGGDPLGSGMGGPGYKLNLEVKPAVKHDQRGVLSTANSGANTDGSQYFIMFAPNAALDGGYSIYGQMVSGEDTLKKIEALGKSRDPAPPSEKIVIEKATISVE